MNSLRSPKPITKTTSAILTITMADISSLESEAAKVGHSLDWWNYVLVGSLALTVLAGVVTFLAQRQTISRTRKLGEINSDIARLKEQNLQRDLKDKDVQIAQAQEAATNARRDLETEQIKRLEMEKSLAPRSLQFILSDTPNFEPLKKFAGINVILWYLPDAEASRATSHLLQLFELAGWNVVSKEARSELNVGYFDGVSVEVRSAKDAPPPNEESQKDIQRREETADALIDFLESNNWYAHTSFADNTLPKNTIKINVGFKPFPYLFPEWVKEGKKKGKEIRQRVKELRKTWDERRNQLQQQPRKPNEPPN